MTLQPPDITINQNDFQNVSSRIASLPDAVRLEVLYEASAYAAGVLADETPDRVNHDPEDGVPYEWNSPKQRRWFFANIDPPSERTGALESGWTADVTPYGAKIANEQDYAGYVMGEAQQIGHKVDGWKLVKDILSGKLSFRSSSFRAVVMGAVQAAMRKVKLG